MVPLFGPKTQDLGLYTPGENGKKGTPGLPKKNFFGGTSTKRTPEPGHPDSGAPEPRNRDPWTDFRGRTRAPRT